MNTYLIFIYFNILNISAYYIKYFKQYSPEIGSLHKTSNYQDNLLKHSASPENKYFDIFTNKEQLIRYITSFRDFTIITDGDKAKDLFAKMEKEKYNTYYMDLNNLVDKNDIIYYLVKKYNTNNSGANIWVFKREFLIGSGEDALKLISKNIKIDG